MTELPDPTRAEARALILGTGGFWAGWGLSVPFFTNQVPFGLVAFFLAFGCGAWLHFGGIFHVLARAQGKSVLGWYFEGLRQPPWRAWRSGYGWGWMRLVLPSYYRRAARALGWNEVTVLVILGTLLTSDLVALVFLFSNAPAST